MQSIQKKMTKDGICVLTFDRPDSTANIFDLATLTALESALDAIAGEKSQPKGLIITSAKEAIFVAGADLHAIQKMSGEEMKSFIALGADSLQPDREPAVSHRRRRAWRRRRRRLRDLPGLRLARGIAGVLHEARSSRDEARHPARLGRLHPPAAPDRRAARAGHHSRRENPRREARLKLGMVDEVVPREHLIAAAKSWLQKGKHPHRFSYSAPVNAILDTVIAPQARHAVMQKTRGHYPAPQKALEVVIKGATDWNENESLAREREAVAELIALESTKNLLRVFFLQERARKLSAPGIWRAHPPFRRFATSPSSARA
jgi:3-hydroxyacyl-CoA dehydrogenase/enoyl-CoA hydratase/3-hydroxybutyryl-CoA epimerase